MNVFNRFAVFLLFSSNIEISLSDGQPSQTVVSTVSSVASNTSIGAKKQEVKKEVPTEEKLNTSETVRQMLQDEMFKLVQVRASHYWKQCSQYKLCYLEQWG